ncbi:ubiquinone anaerobic biosynthesis protein UbiV [Azospirillum rugosum]|uniref:Ubiquinone biosynthesis protein UbiV n=1 Tax=Azospirillum rugosum TaxID=416170 RepID=A0ABS4SDL9_9PROT|nr:U32 family peptidase [Azospirillum rugosum]MBP2290672.1 collagenase-like PrtC family protease [Azospirillum rugosum]MDQ0525560.1 collagenase-like PrtC family protease [Azospirillum rugosum]
MTATMNDAQLTLGPLLFNWPLAAWHDFYARIADEAPVDSVHLGEIVCSKRAPFFADHLPDVIERLTAAGKRVLLSTPILVTTDKERAAVRELLSMDGVAFEANDTGALLHLAGRPHAVGPYVNVYNEGTLAWLAGRGATSVTLPAELPEASIRAIAAAAAPLGVAVEVQVFGRIPLAISARCYHARSHGLYKDGCQFVCGQDADGLPVDTLDGEPFLAVNGLQTLSRRYLSLADRLDGLRSLGVSRFRLSPHAVDMVEVARLFRAVLDGALSGADADARVAERVGEAGITNGFLLDRPGADWVGAAHP